MEKNIYENVTVSENCVVDNYIETVREIKDSSENESDEGEE